MAYDHGAAAILLYDPDAAAASGGGGFRGGRGDPSFEPTRHFLAFSITDRVYNALMRQNDQEIKGDRYPWQTIRTRR